MYIYVYRKLDLMSLPGHLPQTVFGSRLLEHELVSKIWGQNSVPPVNIPTPSKIDQNGWCTYPKTVPLVLTHGLIEEQFGRDQSLSRDIFEQRFALPLAHPCELGSGVSVNLPHKIRKRRQKANTTLLSEEVHPISTAPSKHRQVPKVPSNEQPLLKTQEPAQKKKTRLPEELSCPGCFWGPWCFQRWGHKECSVSYAGACHWRVRDKKRAVNAN